MEKCKYVVLVIHTIPTTCSVALRAMFTTHRLGTQKSAEKPQLYTSTLATSKCCQQKSLDVGTLIHYNNKAIYAASYDHQALQRIILKEVPEKAYACDNQLLYNSSSGFQIKAQLWILLGNWNAVSRSSIFWQHCCAVSKCLMNQAIDYGNIICNIINKSQVKRGLNTNTIATPTKNGNFSVSTV